MISYVNKTVTIGKRAGPIKSFEVWFRTPAGLFDSFDAAVSHCVALDHDPDTHIIPVTVALGPEFLYEEIPR